MRNLELRSRPWLLAPTIALQPTAYLTNALTCGRVANQRCRPTRWESIGSVLTDNGCVAIIGYPDASNASPAPDEARLLQLLEYPRDSPPVAHAWSGDGHLLLVACLRSFHVYQCEWRPARDPGLCLSLVHQERLHFCAREACVSSQVSIGGDGSDRGDRALQHYVCICGADGFHLWSVTTSRGAVATGGSTPASAMGADASPSKSDQSHPGTGRAVLLQEGPSLASTPTTACKYAGTQGTDGMPVCCAAFSPDNRYFAAAFLDGRIWMWEVEDDEDICFSGALPAGAERVTCMRFSHDASWLAVGCWTGHVLLYHRPADNGVILAADAPGAAAGAAVPSSGPSGDAAMVANGSSEADGGNQCKSSMPGAACLTMAPLGSSQPHEDKAATATARALGIPLQRWTACGCIVGPPTMMPPSGLAMENMAISTGSTSLRGAVDADGTPAEAGTHTVEQDGGGRLASVGGDSTQGTLVVWHSQLAPDTERPCQYLSVTHAGRHVQVYRIKPLVAPSSNCHASWVCSIPAPNPTVLMASRGGPTIPWGCESKGYLSVKGLSLSSRGDGLMVLWRLPGCPLVVTETEEISVAAKDIKI